MPLNTIGPTRKAAYGLGVVLQVACIVLFLSGMAMFATAGEAGFLLGLFAMALGIAGKLLARTGARGLAGSGVILDPEGARRDLEPWARAAGGLLADGLDEARPDAPLPPSAIKVRCPNCRALNDEDAKFCKSCATPL